VAYPQAVSWTAPGPRSSLELSPDRLRVALAADEQRGRLIGARRPVGLEALPYVLGVAGEHQGRPRLTVPVPIATAPRQCSAVHLRMLRLSPFGLGPLVCVRVLEPAEGDPGLAWGVVELS